ncbi:stealth conserved region 3 domain-containing protein [Pseudomonas sp. Pse1]|uniref:stealth conserved region 3 domain-containing protein n=1 Tax=Pseudomonas sp. Pse1 TaxID=2926020 RepID=UPI0004871000|nr:stealth conserved region 3 domain-containing protein [Pseudomonas sp. Pse1]
MNRKSVKFKKFKKFISDPNMFFYDMFRKRVFKDAPSVALDKTASTAVSSVSSAPTVDLLEINRMGLVNYIRKNLNAGIGAEDGQDPNSLVIWSGYLNGLIGFIAGLRETTPTNVTIYTLGGGVSVTSPAGEKFDTKAICRALNSRPDFVIELCNPLNELYVLHFYLYDLAPTGEATVRSNRAWVRRFPISDFDIIFNRPSASVANSRIDAVYTWVNHADEAWQKLWVESFPDEDFDPDRYTSNDELRYSLRSLNKYAPWLGKIHIVSNCSRPNWLDDDERINWVDHDSIFPDKDALPTFNSHAIEACLHRIEELSEHFIYLNDDFILSQPCLPSDFFDETGRSMAYFEPYGMVSDNAQPEAPDYLIAAQNSRELLARDFPHYQPRNLHRHVPYCLKKSVLNSIESKYPWAFARTRHAKRRSETDINLTSFLYHHFAFASGQAVKADAPGLIVRPNNVNAVTSKDIFKYKLLCFNDGNGSAEDNDYKLKTQQFFNTRLPQRAPWERMQVID